MRRLLLVGGGHAHLFVLEHWARADRVPDTELAVVLDRERAVYSGMVPGFVAGLYDAEEISIDVARLARVAGASVLAGTAAVAVDPRARHVTLADGKRVAYDVLSLDVGSTVRGLDTPGAEMALATRPIAHLVAELDRRLRLGSQSGGPTEIVVVGGGAGGVELAFAVEARLARASGRVRVTLVDAGPRLLDGYPAAARHRVEAAAQARGIGLVTGVRVASVRPSAALLEDGRALDADLVLWATGAAPPPLLAKSHLALDQRGFLRVRDTLQVEGDDDVFAAGDCASIVNHPWVPKAGVYAVRQGPILAHNLHARLTGASLRKYHPQRRFLSLLALGDETAIASRGPFSARGRSLWQLKDWIDRRFVRRFG